MTFSRLGAQNTSAKVMMSQTKDYVLKIVDNDNPETIITETIHFDVVPAKPTIKLASKSGVLVTTGDEVEILSNAAAPGGFSVKKVEFYLNDELYQTSEEAPFSCSWVAPTTLGDYKFYGIVYNDNEDEEFNSKQSDVLTITVTDMEKTRFEAEYATLKDISGSTVKTDAACSNSKYLDLHEFSYIMFSNIIAPEDGDYQVCVACRAPYGYKEATLYINSISNAKTITMEESQDWEVKKMVFSLKKGENKITIKSAWGWQQFDYLDIRGVGIAVLDGESPLGRGFDFTQPAARILREFLGGFTGVGSGILYHLGLDVVECLELELRR